MQYLSFDIVVFSIVSVVLVSLISLIGVVFLVLDYKRLKKAIQYLVSIAAGSLLGGAFFHLIPESVEKSGGFLVNISIYILGGIAFFFVLEKIVQWRHCHIPTSDEHPHSFAYLNLFGDGVHNLIDGFIIAGGFLISVNLGIVTTLAVVLHEIPQEIGDFGVLIYGGFKIRRAILLNFITALTAVLGVLLALFFESFIGDITVFLAPFAAGGFIYIGGSDLIPELNKTSNRKEYSTKQSVLQFITFIVGVALMGGLLLI